MRSALLLLALLSLLSSCSSTAVSATDDSLPTAASTYLPTTSVRIDDVNYAGDVTVVIFPFAVRLASYRNCDEEHHACYQKCKRTPPPWPIIQGSSGHTSYCNRTCLAQYMECLASNALTYSFQGMKQAASWLYRHPEVVAGAIVIAGGIAFSVTTEGASLMLIPKGAQMMR